MPDRLASPMPMMSSRPATCWSCGGAIDDADRYCRHCGQGRGAALAWYYRPLWIAVLTLTALGPFALPLVWRTPRLDRTGKWAASLVIILLTAWIGWELLETLRRLGSLLDSDISLT